MLFPFISLVAPTQVPPPPRQPGQREFVGPSQFMLNPDYQIDLLLEALRIADPAIALEGLRMLWSGVGPIHTNLYPLDLFRCKLKSVRTIVLTDLIEYPPQPEHHRGLFNGCVLYQEPLDGQFSSDINVTRASMRAIWSIGTTKFDIQAKSSSTDPAAIWKTAAQGEIVQVGTRSWVKYTNLRGVLMGVFILGDTYHDLVQAPGFAVQLDGPFSDPKLYGTFERFLLAYQFPVQYDGLSEARRYFLEKP